MRNLDCRPGCGAVQSLTEAQMPSEGPSSTVLHCSEAGEPSADLCAAGDDPRRPSGRTRQVSQKMAVVTTQDRDHVLSARLAALEDGGAGPIKALGKTATMSLSLAMRMVCPALLNATGGSPCYAGRSSVGAHAAAIRPVQNAPCAQPYLRLQMQLAARGRRAAPRSVPGRHGLRQLARARKACRLWCWRLLWIPQQGQTTCQQQQRRPPQQRSASGVLCVALPHPTHARAVALASACASAMPFTARPVASSLQPSPDSCELLARLGTPVSCHPDVCKAAMPSAVALSWTDFRWASNDRQQDCQAHEHYQATPSGADHHLDLWQGTSLAA